MGFILQGHRVAEVEKSPSLSMRSPGYAVLDDADYYSRNTEGQKTMVKM